MGGHRISPPTDHHRPIRPAPTDSLARARGFARVHEDAPVKQAEEVMEILEAFDLVGTLRGAAELAGCDHRVARFAGECVDDRDADRDEGEALPVGR